jgi:hypothetical protein
MTYLLNNSNISQAMHVQPGAYGCMMETTTSAAQLAGQLFYNCFKKADICCIWSACRKDLGGHDHMTHPLACVLLHVAVQLTGR